MGHFRDEYYTSLFRHRNSENKPNNKTRMTKTTTQKNNSNSSICMAIDCAVLVTKTRKKRENIRTINTKLTVTVPQTEEKTR